MSIWIMWIVITVISPEIITITISICVIPLCWIVREEICAITIQIVAVFIAISIDPLGVILWKLV